MKTVTFKLTLAVFDVKQRCRRIGVWHQSTARVIHKDHKESLV